MQSEEDRVADASAAAAHAARPWRHPLAISDIALSDNVNWMSFPPHYPHLVRFPHDDGNAHYAIRMRQSDGSFGFSGESSTSPETMTRKLELVWAELGTAHKCEPSCDLNDLAELYDEFLEPVLAAGRAALATHPQDPSWASPLAPVELSAMHSSVRESIPLLCPVVEKSWWPNGQAVGLIFEKLPPENLLYPDCGSPDIGKRITALKRGFTNRVFMHQYFGYATDDLAERHYEDISRGRKLSAVWPSPDGSEGAAAAETAIEAHRQVCCLVHP